MSEEHFPARPAASLNAPTAPQHASADEPASIASLEQRIATLETDLEDAARHFLAREQSHLAAMEELKQLLREDAPAAVQMRVALEETRYSLQSLEQELHSVKMLYASLVHSASWRYTKPFRALARLLRGDRESFADGIWNQVRPYALALPKRRARRADKITYSLIMSLSRLLEPSLGYRRWHQGYLAARTPQRAGVALTGDNVDAEIAKLKFPVANEPILSIIIAAAAQLKPVLGALRSLSVFPPSVLFEVIVAKGTSEDGDLTRINSIEGIRLLQDTIDLGVLRACNHAARQARGSILFFMDANSEVTSGALDQLLGTLDRHQGVGIVGAKLVNADGRLRQAGGIVWQDGSVEAFGHGDDAALLPYNALRETDFCSGTALMIRRDLFEQVGGFDTSYVASEFADADLAFKVRAANRTVVYQPASNVLWDAISQDTDANDASSTDPLASRSRFRERWGDVLDRDQCARGTPLFRAKDRSPQRLCLLAIDQSIPAADRDAGSRSLIQFMTTFQEMGLNVKFWPKDGIDETAYANRLQQQGIEVLAGDPGPESFAKWYQEHGVCIDYVLLSRPHVAVDFLPIVKSVGAARILFYGHDIHHLRIAMQIEAGTADHHAAQSLQFFKKLEPQLWPQMDVIYYPSAEETEIVSEALRQEHATTVVRTVPVYAFDSFPEVSTDPAQRSGLLFVGGFKHAPNADGMIWFKDEVMPLILKQLPQTRLTIVGSNPTPAVTALADRTTRVAGFISDQELEHTYTSARVAIAPLRFGAGMKGKVAEALRFGVPVVTTPVGAQGLEGAAAAMSIAGSAKAFADHVVALLCSDDLWRSHSIAAQDFAREHLSSACLRRIFELDVHR